MSYFGSYFGSYYGSWYGGTTAPVVVGTTPSLLGGGKKKRGGYHSWTLHYEAQLLAKSLKEKKEKENKIEEIREEVANVKQKIALVKSPKSKKLPQLELNLERLLELLNAEILLLEKIKQQQLIYRNNIALIIISMALPFGRIANVR